MEDTLDEALELLRQSERVSDFDKNVIACKRSALEQSARTEAQGLTGGELIQWVAKWLSKASLEHQHSIFQRLFVDLSTDAAKKLAKKPESATSDVDLLLSGAVYGEVEFASMVHILQICMQYHPKSETEKLSFVDLGHGTGKALIVAALLYADIWSEIRGIEYGADLHAESLKRIDRFSKLFLEDELLLGTRQVPIVAEESDFLLLNESTFDWTSADVVFANSTCFTSEMMLALGELSNRMTRGSLFVTLTYPLPSALSTNAAGESQTPTFAMVWRVNLPMSWGIATAYFHRRQ